MLFISPEKVNEGESFGIDYARTLMAANTAAVALAAIHLLNHACRCIIREKMSEDVV